MRVISQDGCYDIPYEQAMLLRYGSRIYLMIRKFTGVERTISDQVIAEYSTEEKAIKAMKMCREYYDSIFFEPQSEIFQFPAEEEVE